jgi:hypothetical protein
MTPTVGDLIYFKAAPSFIYRVLATNVISYPYFDGNKETFVYQMFNEPVTILRMINRETGWEYIQSLNGIAKVEEEEML